MQTLVLLAISALLMPAAEALAVAGCAGGRCGRHEHEAADDVAAARVEMVKRQILSKLRMMRPPAPNLTLAALPRPLAAAANPNAHNQNSFEEFYGKTDQVILFPDQGVQTCSSNGSSTPASCFTFSLPESIAADNLIESATLWLHKRTFPLASGEQQINLWAANSSLEQLQMIASVWSKLKESWVKIKLEVVEQWMNNSQLQQKIRVECPTCGSDESEAQLRDDQLPFLVISTRSITAPQRVRRSINCMPGIKECCRENLRINFEEIGWGNWILQPTGYDAYFCRGSCNNPAAIAQSGSFYTSIIQKYLTQSTSRIKNRVDLTPCCTPTKFSSLQLLYVDSKNVVMQKTLPNMVVDSCGCL